MTFCIFSLSVVAQDAGALRKKHFNLENGLAIKHDITFICLVFKHANVFQNVVEYCRVYDIEKTLQFINGRVKSG